jgi:hypothetical protein
MSIGTALVLIALGVLFYLRPKVFFITIKVFGVLVVIAGLGFGAWYGYGKYKDHREARNLAASTEKAAYEKQTQLNGISLGMKKVEVTVAMGSKADVDKDDGILVWRTPGELLTFVELGDKTKTVSIICLRRYEGTNFNAVQHDIFGLKVDSPEQQMIAQLGSSPKVSINANALSKTVSYPDLQVAFELSGQVITSICVTDHPLKYTKEYDEKAEAQAKLEKKQAEEKAAAEAVKQAERQAELEAANARAKKLRESQAAQEAAERAGFDQRLRSGKTTPADLDEVKNMAGRYCAKNDDDRNTATKGFFYNQCVENRIRNILAGNL